MEEKNEKATLCTAHQEHHKVELPRQNRLIYRLSGIITGFVARVFFKRKFIRNEIKGKKGPFVIIANHQAAYDFVNLMGATREMMHFVISESFYNTLSIRGIIKRLGVIPKQQFQTSLRDLKLMKTVIEEGKILVIYPAGLMCEDGLSTPIPEATYQFLKWIKADIYVARTYGTYFAMPKWSRGIRRGRTYLDIYKLFEREQLEQLEIPEVKEKTEAALLFDAYREQESRPEKYKGGDNIEGLEEVLYICPHCKREHVMRVRDKSVIYCEACGFAERCDEYGFLHKISEVGDEIRYVPDWSRLIHCTVRRKLIEEHALDESCECGISVIDVDKKKFVDAGEGILRLNWDHICIDGTVNGSPVSVAVQTANFASVPFSPAKYLEIQHNAEIYRLYPKEPRRVMEFVHKIKVLYEIHTTEHAHNS